MANYRAIATGNWSNGATWAGGSVPPNGQGHNIYSNTFTVTIDTNVDVALITNAANAGTFVGGGTAAIGGGFTVSANPSITANITGAGTVNCLSLTGTQSATLVGNVSGGAAGVGMHGIAAISLNTTGSLGITGNIIGSTAALTWAGHGINLVLGNLIINGNVTAGLGGQGTIYGCHGINSSGSGILILNGNVFGNSTSISGASGTVCRGIQNSGAAVISVIGNCTAGTGTSNEAIFSSNASATISVQGQITAVNGVNAVNCIGNSTTTFSCTLTSAVDGTQPIYSTRYRVSPVPLSAKTRYALNGAGTYVDMFTADNSTALNQAAPTDVRAGVAYGISNSQTGRLTVPARGSVALSVNYGPSMPFTATRSGTTATATLAYSYPLVVGDEFTVTGASNTEWNGTYSVASVVSGTSVTFTVPDTHSVTAGTGATMQTTGTAVLDPAAVASAVWGAASRTITGGVVDTLTNAPTVPTAAAIADEVRVELATELARIDAPISGAGNAPSASTVATAVRSELSTELARVDAAISSRLASSAYSAAPTTAQIATAIEGSLLNEADGQAVLNAIVSAIGNQNLSEVSLVAAVRADLERNGGKLDSIPTDAAPSAASVATAVWSASTKEITGGTVTTLTNSPDVPTEAEIASQVRTELSVELGRIDAAVSSRLAGSSYTAPANSDVAAIKAKTDALNTERLANVATTAIVGNLIAQANS